MTIYTFKPVSTVEETIERYLSLASKQALTCLSPDTQSLLTVSFDALTAVAQRYEAGNVTKSTLGEYSTAVESAIYKLRDVEKTTDELYKKLREL